MSNEWIKWEGGECPVRRKEMVDVKFFSGAIYCTGDRAGSFKWNHGLDTDDIISYRLHCDCDGCTEGDDEIPKFLRNPMNDDGITEHEFDEPGDGIPEELAMEDMPPVLRPETEKLKDRVVEKEHTKCSCTGCENKATHTWSGHPTCDECGTSGRRERAGIKDLVEDKAAEWAEGDNCTCDDTDRVVTVVHVLYDDVCVRGSRGLEIYSASTLKPIKSPKEKAIEEIDDLHEHWRQRPELDESLGEYLYRHEYRKK